jgi:large subunit ribosomal protein L23
MADKKEIEDSVTKTAAKAKEKIKQEVEEKAPIQEKGRKKAKPEEYEDASALKFVYMTEKAIRNIEKENKIVFIVNRKSTKAEIKKSVEFEYNQKVSGIQTLIDQKGRKRATIKFEKANAAGDIAIKLGII